jgi:hypothetical protein
MFAPVIFMFVRYLILHNFKSRGDFHNFGIMYFFKAYSTPLLAYDMTQHPSSIIAAAALLYNFLRSFYLSAFPYGCSILNVGMISQGGIFRDIVSC